MRIFHSPSSILYLTQFAKCLFVFSPHNIVSYFIPLHSSPYSALNIASLGISCIYIVINVPQDTSDRLCGLVVRVPSNRSRGPVSIPVITTFSEKQWVWSGVHSASWVKLRSYLEKKSSGSGLENREYGRRNPSRWPRGSGHPQKLALTSPISGGRLVGIVRSRTQVTEFSFFSKMQTVI
jgi:hypothetical protein